MLKLQASTGSYDEVEKKGDQTTKKTERTVEKPQGILVRIFRWEALQFTGAAWRTLTSRSAALYKGLAKASL